jgi:glycerate dehydrogenase
MRIVVLDGYTLNPGDLRWDPLSSLGELTVHERTPPASIVSRSYDAPIVLTNKTPLDAATLGALPGLRYIGVLATGYNIVDVRAARERGVAVTNVPAYATMSVAQTVFAHLFMLTHSMGHHTDAVRQGRWAASADFSFRDFPLVELSGQTMGIVGLGRIGRAVAEAARAFGMKVLASQDASKSDPPSDVRRASLAEVFAASDVLSLHCPLTAATEGLVNRERLALMKPTAYLINTSRGSLVDEAALAEALNAGKIAGAGLDVLSEEPPRRDNPLLHAKNCFITPHFAWGTVAARTRLLQEAAENVRAFLEGRERNIVA